jgi:hypothetical protein
MAIPAVEVFLRRFLPWLAASKTEDAGVAGVVELLAVAVATVVSMWLVGMIAIATMMQSAPSHLRVGGRLVVCFERQSGTTFAVHEPPSIVRMPGPGVSASSPL